MTQVQEGGGVILGGFGVLAVLAMLFGGGPVLAGLHSTISGAFGAGWPLPVAAAIALGVVLVLPSLPLPTPRIVIAAAAAGLAVFGLLSVARHPAGGALGTAIGDLIASLIGRPGAVTVLLVVLLLGVIVAFRFSPGGVLLRIAHTTQAAYAERRRLDALVERVRHAQPEPQTEPVPLPSARQA
ncbi:MAG: hypothetical protein WAM30_14845, partial [Candidatus Dormiibacterota bacterium]